jgi:predicted DNA-binding transcriptional regulator AlpA
LRSTGDQKDAGGDASMQNEVNKLALTIAEFVQLSGMGRSYIYQEIKAGRLIVRKAGRRSLILRDEGLAWLANLPAKNQRRASGGV